MFPPFLRVSGTLRKESPFSQTHHKTTAIKRMALKLNTKTARIDLDISVEAQLRFAEIHKALGFKTKPETFEAIIYSVSMRDKIDPAILDRVESKLDHALEVLESLA
jgi:hypothetical protein